MSNIECVLLAVVVLVWFADGWYLAIGRWLSRVRYYDLWLLYVGGWLVIADC